VGLDWWDDSQGYCWESLASGGFTLRYPVRNSLTGADMFYAL